MGILLSRVRKKKSTIETLEKLDHDIKEIEEKRSNAQRNYKRITNLLLIYSLGLYILCGVIFYFQFTSTLRGTLLYLVPLAISPLLLYIVRRIISWYFVRLLNKNQIRLNEMKKEKKRILDEVMDKETYKVAKQILEKFGEDTVSKPNYNMQLSSLSETNNGLKRRTAAATGPSTNRVEPPIKSFPSSQALRPIMSSPNAGRPLPASSTPMLRFPAPILPLQRTYVDRIVEYLIGDGPNNRYALICSHCHSHNGMALKEEFEYIGFKCCYCFHYNPARKVKPEAPKLETSFKLKREPDTDSDKNSSEENSEADAHQTVEMSEFTLPDEVESETVETSAVAPDDPEQNVPTPDPKPTLADSIPLSEAPTSNSVEEHHESNQPTEITESNTNCDESLVET